MLLLITLKCLTSIVNLLGLKNGRCISSISLDSEIMKALTRQMDSSLDGVIK